MSITKQTIVDRIDTLRIKDHFFIEVREKVQVLENGEIISENHNRYSLSPDHDVNTITDSTTKKIFETVMTDVVKAEYETFKNNLD